MIVWLNVFARKALAFIVTLAIFGVWACLGAAMTQNVIVFAAMILPALLFAPLAAAKA